MLKLLMDLPSATKMSTNKVALVTGSATGLGYEIAFSLTVVRL